MTKISSKRTVQIDDLTPDEFFEDDKKKPEPNESHDEKSSMKEKELQP